MFFFFEEHVRNVINLLNFVFRSSCPLAPASLPLGFLTSPCGSGSHETPKHAFGTWAAGFHKSSLTSSHLHAQFLISDIERSWYSKDSRLLNISVWLSCAISVIPCIRLWEFINHLHWIILFYYLVIYSPFLAEIEGRLHYHLHFSSDLFLVLRNVAIFLRGCVCVRSPIMTLLISDDPVN